MSRSGYSDDGDFALWRGQVASAIRGKRGQRLLRDLLAALDAMPEKRLIANELEADGEVCALGACGRFRGVDMSELDPQEPEEVAAAFDIAHQLAQEIVYVNDECGDDRWDPVNRCTIYETPEKRWQRVRTWVLRNLKNEAPLA